MNRYGRTRRSRQGERPLANSPTACWSAFWIRNFTFASTCSIASRRASTRRARRRGRVLRQALAVRAETIDRPVRTESAPRRLLRRPLFRLVHDLRGLARASFVRPLMGRTLIIRGGTLQWRVSRRAVPLCGPPPRPTGIRVPGRSPRSSRFDGPGPAPAHLTDGPW